MGTAGGVLFLFFFPHGLFMLFIILFVGLIWALITNWKTVKICIGIIWGMAFLIFLTQTYIPAVQNIWLRQI
jgi:hypothetical protein